MNAATYQTLEQEGQRRLSREDYERYLPMVRRIAMKLARRVPSTISVSDLVSCGWLGLLEAFSRSRDGMPQDEFEAYASHRIRGAILDYLRRLDPGVREARNASRRITRAIHAVSKAKGREPTEAEIAKEMGLDVGAYQQLLQGVSKAGLARLEVLDFDEHQIAGDDDGPDEEAGRRMILGALAEAIPHLSERLQQVLGLYYQEGCTLKEIGAILGVSESRVCQLHSEAIHKLRARIGRE
jgi:RNA polymerase sigma factor for flagellar operon FliA